MMDMRRPHFWQTLDQLVASAEVMIDRPKGSDHPNWPDFRYPLDYGYLAGTTSSDGAGIDVWIGSMADNPRRVTGMVCTIDNLKRDAEIKVLLNCTPDEMQTIRTVHTGETMACYVIPRPDK